MGMEGFNAVPEPTRPEDEGRIHDVEKAQVMANAGNENRSWAAREREAAESENNSNKKEWFESGAEKYDKDAEYLENREGKEWDRVNNAEGYDRIDDVAKAQATANAEKSSRDEIAELKEIQEEGGKIPFTNIPNKINRLDADANFKGEVAGSEFERRKQEELHKVKKQLGI